MSILSVMQHAAEQAVALINSVGTESWYTPKSTGIKIKVNVMHRALGSAELIGDYRQGDLRIELDASKLGDAPKQYDELQIGDFTYMVKDGNGSPRRVGSIIYTYKFVVRGA